MSNVGIRNLKSRSTEGWECNLRLGGVEIFFANNGFGGFLGPNWKVFHHWTLRDHFQGAVIAFGSRPDREKRVERGWKIYPFFCPQNIQYVPRVDEKSRNMKNWVHTCPKTHKKLFLSAFFSVKMGHFLLFFLTICVLIAATNFCKQLRGVCSYRWWNTCIHECLALVSPAQLFAKKRNGQNAPQGHEIIERSITL